MARAASRLRLGHKAPFHLKIDTGMGRLGIPLAELEGIQASNRTTDMELIERAYRALKIDAGFYGFA